MEFISGSSLSIRDIFMSPGWDSFYATNYHNIRPVVIESITKILACGSGDNGYATFSCQCGEISRVPFTCKNRFCSKCGKVACDMWMNRVLSWALPNITYRHIVFTIPEELRLYILMNRKDGIDILFKASKDTLIQFCNTYHHAIPGLISVIHTFGSDIKWNPHCHVITTSGGLSEDKNHWIPFSFMTYQKLRCVWKEVLTLLLQQWASQHLFGDELFQFNQLLRHLAYKHWYVNVGDPLDSLAHTVQYIGRYSKRPVMAETRLLHMDEHNIHFSYKDKDTKKNTPMSLPIHEFIARLIRHIPEKNHRMIRYSGLFANRIKSISLNLISNILSVSQQCLYYFIPPPMSWRDRIILSSGKDPLACSLCGSIMILSSITFRNRFGILKTRLFPP